MSTNKPWREWEGWQDSRHIPNAELKADDIPADDETWDSVKKFAMSFDGLSHWGSFSKCADIVYEHPEETLTAYRTELYLQHRKQRHLGAEPDEHTMAHIRGLIDKIRGKVAAGVYD